MFERPIHYVYGDWDGCRDSVQHQCRPAVVVNTWGNVPSVNPDGCYNLQIFTDGTNDYDPKMPCAGGMHWATSRKYHKPVPFEGGAAPPDSRIWEARILFKPNTWHFADECYKAY